MEWRMTRWAVLAAVAAAASAAGAVTWCGSAGSSSAAARAVLMPAKVEQGLKGYDTTRTRLKPTFPHNFECSPLTSLYASWIDVDGTRRDEIHSGIDGGRLGDPVLAPASGRVRRVWVADWGQGREGALLIAHRREDLGLSRGADLYYAEFDHLRYGDISGLKEGQRIVRGQQIASVFRPGGKSRYLPEVHLETYEVADDNALTWNIGEHGTAYFKNPKSRLIDPLYLFSLEVRPNARREVEIQPFDAQRNYGGFRGYTYHLPCRKRGPQS
jgi:murein DD-endopeptidase MepM/ murein hydrolase activator NlpD